MMSANSPINPNQLPKQISDDEIQQLVQLLRRKDGGWVLWGQRCYMLQQAGFSPQKLFEETGFEPVQQNQVIVAAQVYGALLRQEASEDVRSHFQNRGSDVLYEFRILNQSERAAAATMAFEKGVDADDAHEIARAIKAYSRLTSSPQGFAEFDEHPGDSVAYYYWKLARQQSDLQSRSRLIAQGLKFAESATARQAIEKLLTDFTVVKSRPAPTMPFYRMNTEEEIPRIVPVAGVLPLDTESLMGVPLVEAEKTFSIVKFSGMGAWVALPGWQVVIQAEDPIVLLGNTTQLPLETSDDPEEVLILIDRAQREWNDNQYFLFDMDGQIQVQWSPDHPTHAVLGRVVLVLKPKRILDEEFLKKPWQLDE